MNASNSYTWIDGVVENGQFAFTKNNLKQLVNRAWLEKYYTVKEQSHALSCAAESKEFDSIEEAVADISKFYHVFD